jgi:hypothetical protein
MTERNSDRAREQRNLSVKMRPAQLRNWPHDPQVIIFVLDARVEIMTRGFHEVASSKILVILNLKSCLFSVCYRQRHIHRLLVQLLLVSPSNKNTLE